MTSVFFVAAMHAQTTSRPCHSLPGQPCRFHCPISPGPGAQFDLSLIDAEARQRGGYLHTDDADGHSYHFSSGCSPLATTCAGSASTSPVAIQSWGGAPPHFPSGTCASLGDMSTQGCWVDWRDPQLTCRYSGGDSDRSVVVHYKCDPSIVVPQLAAAQATTSPTSYSITITGASVCSGALAPRPPPPSPPLPPPSSCASWCNVWTCELPQCTACTSICPHSPPPPRASPPYPPRTPAWVFRPPPSPPPPPPAPPGAGTCVNTCTVSSDGDCDDGGPGARYSVCGACTDCADCGQRAYCDFDVAPPPPRLACAAYLEARSRYPYCDPPTSRGDKWAVDLASDFGPRCDSNQYAISSPIQPEPVHALLHDAHLPSCCATSKVRAGRSVLLLALGV